MAVYELDPHRFLPAGHQIIDGGPARLPRTYITPAVRPVRNHENFMVAEVTPSPDAAAMGAVREEVVEFLHDRGMQVRSTQPWFTGVGLFEVRSAAVRYSLTQQPPFPLGPNHFVRFFNHDEGEGFRDATDHRSGWLMFIGVPLDLRNANNLREAVNTFGKFHYWDDQDPYLLRSMVFASFPDVPLVP